MLPLLASFALCFLQTGTALERLDGRLRGSAGFDADVEVSWAGRGSAKGHYSFRRPGFQRFRLTASDLDQEYVQGPTASLLIDHRAKVYVWYPGVDGVIEPPPEASPLIRLGTPSLFASPSLNLSSSSKDWSTEPSEAVRGTPATKLTWHKGNESLQTWVSNDAVPLRMATSTETEAGPVNVSVEFTRFVWSARPKESFDIKLPEGYIPLASPVTARVAAPGDVVRLGQAQKWPGGGTMDVGAAARRGPLVVAVTSQDLEQAVPDLRWLADKAKAARFGFVQVWVGTRPTVAKEDWDVCWDADGSIEKALGITVTPHFFVIRGTTVQNAWSGWLVQEREEAAKVLLGPPKKSD